MINKQGIFAYLVFFLCCSVLGNNHPGHSRHVKVLVLGAGASGIKAAETLYHKGIHDILVLEGKDYIGGRIHHVPFRGNLVPLGAGWIHVIGPKNPIWQLAKKLKMKVHYDNYTDFVVRDGEDGHILKNSQQTYAQLKQTLHKADKKIAARRKLSLADVPMSSVLKMSGWHANTKLRDAMEFYAFDFENGISPHRLNSRYYGVTGEGDDVIVTDKRGYAHILEYIAKPFMKNVLLNKVVSEIKHSDHLVKVTTKTGEVYTADHVLVTFSSGVLSNNIVQFKPPLPAWKMDTIQLVPMCYYCKIFFKFPRRFWDDANYILLAQKNRGAYTHWQSFDRPTLLNGKHILLLTITEDQCLRSEKMSDSQVVGEAMTALKKVYGNDIPMPTDLIRNKWNADPMTMGAYSSPVVGFQDEDYKRLQKPVGRVWFAGEYTVKDYGYVHGAHASGERMAKRIIDCTRGWQCDGQDKP